MDGIRIRKAEEKDFDSFNALMMQVHRLHTDARPDIYKPNHNVIDFEKFGSLINGGSILIAALHEKILGTVIFFKKHTSSPNHVDRTVMVVDAIVVDENFRRKGIGSLLMKKVEEESQKEECIAMELSVCAFNEEAKKAYSHMGFKEKTIIMEKPHIKNTGRQ